MRLVNAQKAVLDPASHSAECYGTPTIMERHRHRYEFNNIYRQQFAANGMQFAALSPDGSLVEVIELPSHPWFVAVQYHPEFKSKPTSACIRCSPACIPYCRRQAGTTYGTGHRVGTFVRATMTRSIGRADE